ncbi:MAG: hypothetical protein ACKO3S_00925 [bacterium]
MSAQRPMDRRHAPRHRGVVTMCALAVLALGLLATACVAGAAPNAAVGAGSEPLPSVADSLGHDAESDSLAFDGESASLAASPPRFLRRAALPT